MEELKENETDSQLDQQEFTVEVIRKCVSKFNIDNSWDQNICTLDNKNASNDKTPPYEAIMLIDESLQENSNRKDVSVQTEPNEHYRDSRDDVFYSMNADNQLDGYITDNLEYSLGGKRIRRDSFEDKSQVRPCKKGKCMTSVNDLSLVIPRLSSESETSFKSIKSNYSFKVRKKRRKSESNLFRDVFQKSKKTANLTKYGNESNPGSPRTSRRNNRTKVGRLMEICTWIGKKGYQSLTGLYSDILREPIHHYETEDNNKKKEESNKNELEEIKTEMKKFFEEVNLKHSRLVNENEILQNEIKKMESKIENLEIKLSQHQFQPKPQCAPPPPPPPLPPPPPPPLPQTARPLTRAHTLPRTGSAPQCTSARLTITPEDIANVKLRKTKDNPVRPKPAHKEKQPFIISQHLLEATRAKLGRNRPVAASTPKQQLSELEKCLLQETSVTTLYRRRVTRGSCRSAEELRARPYPAARTCRSPCSPKSPRSTSLSRVPSSPLKFPLVLPP